MKLIKFLKIIAMHFIKGRYDLMFYDISFNSPRWLFRFNKASIMYTENFLFPEKINNDVRVKIADESDIDDIVRISGVSAEHVRAMMKAGGVCFMSHIDGNPPVCVSWSANGRTFVRGMGFYYDLGPDGYYSYGTITLPEARGKGHYLAVESEKIRYELKKGAKRFYGLIEFTNTYSYALQERLGYRPILAITYFKLLPLEFCLVKDLVTGRRSRKIFIKPPNDDILII